MKFQLLYYHGTFITANDTMTSIVSKQCKKPKKKNQSNTKHQLIIKGSLYMTWLETDLKYSKAILIYYVAFFLINIFI